MMIRKAVMIDCASTLAGYSVAIYQRGVTWDTFLIVPTCAMVLAWAWAAEYGTPAEPTPPQPTRKEQRAAYRRAIVKRLERFVGDNRGVTAVEAGIILPLFCVAILGGIDVYQSTQQNSAVNFAATSAALIGGRTLTKGCDAAKQAATDAYTAAVQSGIFGFGSVPTLGTVTCLPDATEPTAVEVTVSATCTSAFPVVGLPTFTATATVRS